MDWDRIEKDWKKYQVDAQQTWGALTDGDWARIQGKRNDLVDRLHQVYGKDRDVLEREVDLWARRLRGDT